MKLPFPFLKILACAFLGWAASSCEVNAQNFVLTNGWSIAAGSAPYMTTLSTERGLAYNPTTGHLLLVSRSTALTNPVVILDPANGSSLGYMNTNGILTNTGSVTFFMNMIGVADDGAIYACNLTSPGSGITNYFIIYRWADEAASPTVAFQGTIGSPGMRFGDNFDVRGAGASTVLMAGQGDNGTAVRGKAIAFFTAADGVNFSATIITNSTAATSDFHRGLSFASTNAYYSKNIGTGTVKHSTFDIGTTNSSVQYSFSGFDNNLGPMTVNVQSNLMAFVRYSSSISANQYVSLYGISSDPSAAPVLMDTKYFPGTAANGNGVGSVDFGGGKLFALNTQNGLMAFDVVATDVVTPPSITTQPLNQAAYVGAPAVTFSVNVIGTAPFSFQWQHNGNNLSNATNATYILSSITTNMAGSYSVVVSNSAGSVTSSAASLTVQVPLTAPVVTNIWSLLPNSRFYLGDSDNAQRGLAYNPVTKNVLLVSRTPSNNIVVLDAETGAEKHFLNVDPAVIASDSSITFPLNAIGIANDGTVYAANLVTAGNANSFRLYSWSDDSTNSTPTLAFSGNPDLSGGSNLRWGDAMSVTGAGTSLRILLAPGTGSTVTIFANVGISGFGPHIVNCIDFTTGDPAPSGFAQFGHAWVPGGAGFFAKTTGAGLRMVSTFDWQTTGTAVVGATYGSANNILNSATALAWDQANALLAMLTFENPDNVRLYDYSDNTPRLIDQELFSVKNVNGNSTGAAAFGDNKLFVLDSNNGIKAFAITPEAQLTPFSITQTTLQSGPAIVLTWKSAIGRKYQVQFSESLSPANWIDLGNPIIAENANTSVTNSTTTVTGFYRVRRP